MYQSKIISYLFFFLFVLPFVIGQNSIPRNIEVHARVIEQLKGSIRSVPNLKLNLIGLGEYTTDGAGGFDFIAPVYEFNRYDLQLNIEVKIDDYEIISPYNGIIQLDTSGSQMVVEILVIGENLDEEYRDQIEKLSKKLLKSEQKNNLSLRRINAMNDSMLKSINRNEKKKTEMENVIARLLEKSQTEEFEKKTLAYDLLKAQRELTEMGVFMKAKDNELFIAMEERYLRQQNYYKAISADLKDFLIHAKDVHDLLQYLEKYFRPGQYRNYTSTYNGTLKAYNGILEKINENYLDYVRGVRRYWGSPLIAKQVEDTFQILFDQVHYPLFEPSINEINGYIRQNKKRKAIKAAHSTFHELNPLILNLEKSVNKTLTILEQEM